MSKAKNTRKKISIAVMGDTKVGKSTMIANYAKFGISGHLKSTVTHLQRRVLSVVEKRVSLNCELYDIEIFDSPSNDTPFDWRLRSEIFNINIDLFIICFAVDSRTAFENARIKWMEEVKDRARYTPILLVGTKSDLRKDKNIDQNCLIDQNEAQLMAENSGALKYLECSSYSSKGLKKVFKTALEIAASLLENELISSSFYCCQIS